LLRWMRCHCPAVESLAPQSNVKGIKARSGLVTSKAVVLAVMVHQLLLNKIKILNRSSLALTPNLSMIEGALTMLSS
jgi:hypothetical protein